MEHNDQQDTWKRLAGEAAVTLIEDAMVVGLGTGTTATQVIYALGRRIQEGLRITGAVATSHASEDLARNLGIPLTDLDTYPVLDLDIDGADEIDDDLDPGDSRDRCGENERARQAQLGEIVVAGEIQVRGAAL